MGIDYDGGMIVGIGGDMLADSIPEQYNNLYDWLVEENDMDSMNLYYDCDEEDSIFGFAIPDVPIDEMDGEWRQDVLEKAAKFEQITGLKPELIGTQNIW